MSRDCADAYSDKQYEHTIAQHPRYVAAASLRQCDDRHSHDDDPSATVYVRAVHSILGWSAAIDRPGASRRLSNRSSCVHLVLPTYSCFSFLAAPRPRRSRFPLARHEDAISQMGAKSDRRQNMRLEPRPEADQTIDSHF